MVPVEVRNLTKHYGDVVGIDDVSFRVDEGEVFGFLGPNGAGKTTTIRTLLGFQSPTSGAATLLGRDVTDASELVEAKAEIGYIPASPSFDDGSTGSEILDLHGQIKGDSRREELLEVFDPPAERPVREYSTGNVQKLAIVQAFMHDPSLVVMDEPTSGLDPLMQHRFNAFILEERRRGVTIFFSSHVLGEVRKLCDRVAILRDGRLTAIEPVQTLLNRNGKLVQVRVEGEIPSAAFDVEGVHELVHRSEGGLTDVSFTYTGPITDLVDALGPHELRDLQIAEAPLEKVFLRFYGGAPGA